MTESDEWNLELVVLFCGPLLHINPAISSIPEDFIRNIFKKSTSVRFKAALSLIGAPNGEQLIKNLLEIPLKEGLTLSQNQLEDRQNWKRSMLALRTVYNLLDTERIWNAVEFIPLSHWSQLLRILPINLEVTACLSKIPSILFEKCSLQPDYMSLHEQLAVLYSILPVESDRTFLTAFFLWFLQTDAGYLSECKGTFNPKAFVHLLEIADTIVDQSSHGKLLLIDYNNVRLVEIYVESVIRNVLDYSDRQIVIELLLPSLSLIANTLIYKPFAEGTFYETSDSTLLWTVCDIFEAICDNDAKKQLDEYHSRVQMEQARGDDEPSRPAPSKPHRRPARPGPASNLSIVFDYATTSQMAELRTSALKALGALAVESEENAEEMAARKLVYLVLTCARITSDSPFQMQHAITSLNMMCKHRENKKILFEIEQTPSGAIDHEKLLAEMGMRAVVDSTSGKLRLEKL